MTWPTKTEKKTEKKIGEEIAKPSTATAKGPNDSKEPAKEEQINHDEVCEDSEHNSITDPPKSKEASTSKTASEKHGDAAETKPRKSSKSQNPQLISSESSACGDSDHGSLPDDPKKSKLAANLESKKELRSRKSAHFECSSQVSSIVSSEQNGTRKSKKAKDPDLTHEEEGCHDSDRSPRPVDLTTSNKEAKVEKKTRRSRKAKHRSSNGPSELGTLNKLLKSRKSCK